MKTILPVIVAACVDVGVTRPGVIIQVSYRRRFP
jgi:hypothetical protein